MKLHIWTDMLSYLAVAHADSVSDARRLLLEESDLGESGDGSCPERDKARCAILGEQPALYVGRVAKFTLSNSAELREQSKYEEALRQQLDAKDRRIAELEAALKVIERRLRFPCNDTEESMRDVARAALAGKEQE